MTDYSLFPFEDYALNEIAAMMIQSVQLGDAGFTRACREQIKIRRETCEDEMSRVRG